MNNYRIERTSVSHSRPGFAADSPIDGDHEIVVWPGTGQRVSLGCNRSDPTLLADHRVRFAAAADVPKSEWRVVSLRRAPQGEWYQDGFGACVGFGAGMTAMNAQSILSRTPRRFSPWWIYAHINGGRDNGATLADAAELLTTVGVCEESLVPDGTILKSRISAEARANAARFKIRCRSVQGFSEVMSEVQCGRVCFVGFDIGAAFEPDAEGFLPRRRGGGGGHCTAIDGATLARGEWWLNDRNSWGDNWGKEGACYVPPSYFDGWHEAYSVELVALDPEESDLPPTAV